MTRPDMNAIRRAVARLDEVPHSNEPHIHLRDEIDEVTIIDAFLYYHDPTPLGDDPPDEWYKTSTGEWRHPTAKFYRGVLGNWIWIDGQHYMRPAPETAGDLRTLVERMERES